ncbi:MAG: DeoR/GlpR family DNA-binding transcription regulator [Spirochaeta sp.]|nr:DeoR/GlpR family DNA-binding transcription regulator [Spirochaeta sp.]
MDNLKDREKTIVRLLADEPLLTVNDISERLNVSVVTARSDMDALADKGYLVRVRGGAIPAFHPDIVTRQQSATEVKRRIAKAAAALVKDGDSIMIESGTTTALIGRYLLGKKDVKVVTDSSLILPYARANPMLSVAFVGGIFRPATESMVGPITISELSQYHVRIAFIGSDGLSCEHGLTTNFVEAAEVSRTMSAHCETTVLVADSAKLGKRGFTQVMPLSDVDILITDNGMDDAAVAQIEECGVSVRRV